MGLLLHPAMISVVVTEDQEEISQAFEDQKCPEGCKSLVLTEPQDMSSVISSDSSLISPVCST